MSEMFKPKQSDPWEKVPEDQKSKFKKEEDGSFVYKEAAENNSRTEKLAEIASVLKKEKITSVDILQGEAIEEVRDKDRTLNYISECIKKGNTDNLKGYFESFKPELLSDEKFVMEAIKRSSYHAGPLIGRLPNKIKDKLKNDKNFNMEIAKISGHIDFASPTILSDKEIVLEAIKHGSSSVFRAISEDLKKDEEVVSEAVKHTSHIYRDLPKEFQSDKKIILAMKDPWLYFKDFPEELRGDKEVCLKAVVDGYANTNLGYASKEMQGDKDVVMAAIREYSPQYEFASDELKKDRVIIFRAICDRERSYVCKFIPEELLSDKKFILEAIKVNPGILSFASDDIRADKEVVNEALLNGGHFNSAGEELKMNKEFILETLSKHTPEVDLFGGNYWQIPKELKDDQDFILAAIKANPRAIVLASDKLRKKIAEALK